jgi:hypothetical protein
MIGVTDGKGEWVVENRDTFLETDLMLAVVLSGFLSILLEAQAHGGSP